MKREPNKRLELTQGFLVLFKLRALTEFMNIFHLSGKIPAQLNLSVRTGKNGKPDKSYGRICDATPWNRGSIITLFGDSGYLYVVSTSSGKIVTGAHNLNR